MKVRTKLLGAGLAIGLIPIIVVGLGALIESRDALSDQAFSRLENAREIKKAQIETFFNERKIDMRSLLDMMALLRK